MFFKHNSQKEQKKFADQDIQNPSEQKMYSNSSETI